MSSKMFPVVVLAIISASLAKTVVPSFKWMNDFKSDEGIPMLNIKFPDNLADDIAVLKKVESGCNLEGHLKFEKNATINITKECDDGNNYQVYIDSRRLVFASYQVSDDEVKPLVPKDDQVVAPKNERIYEVPQNPLNLRLFGYYDSRLRSKLLDASDDVVKAIVEEAKIIFTLPTLQYKISLELVDVEDAEDNLTPENIQESGIITSKASQYVQPINAFVLFTDATDTEVSTGSKIGSICSSDEKERTAVVYWREQVEETGKSLARELGRLLGMGDDYQWNPATNKIKGRYAGKNTLCTNINGIMDYSSKQTVWSPCSNLDFIQYYTKAKSESEDDGFCLKEREGNYQIIEGDVLISGTKLVPGVRLQSPNGYFYLTVSSDGVFGLFCHQDGRKVWTPSDIWNGASASAMLNEDGNFIVYDSEGKANWATYTWNSLNAHLQVQNDGNIVLHSKYGQIWTSNSTATDNLPLTVIEMEKSLYSPNKEFYIHMQNDNNLVVRSSSDNKTLWSTNTTGSRVQPTGAIFQTDGNLVIYDNTGKAYWSTSTQGNPGATMKLLNSGALVIFSYDKTRLWSSVVNGNWGEWLSQDECSLSCGKGVRTLKRACDNPVPSNGGNVCEGSDTDTISCNNEPCPDDVDWDGNDNAKSCDFSGNDLKDIEHTPLKHCAPTCARTPGCTHYTWVEYGSNDFATCFMKMGRKTKQDASRFSRWPSVCGVVASLRGGSNSNEGNVFATNPTSGKFGPICDDGWTKANAHVICKQLGYTGAEKETTKSYFGLVNQEFSYANVKCSGSEKVLEDCRHSTGNICNGGHAAGVVCTDG